MSMVLAEGQISRIEDCIHRDLLTYVSYPLFEGASRCFAYPQFLVEDDSLTLLEDSAFPDNGCLPMIASRTTPRDLLDMFGNIVVMRVNDEHPNRNHNYPENESARYNSIIDPFFTRGASSVEFMPLSKHALSGSLIQVIDVQEIVDLTYPSQNPVHVYSAAALPQTKLVAIAQGKQGQRKLYGPFETTCTEGTGIQLHASNSYGLCIGVFDEDVFSFSIDIVDDADNLVTQYLSVDELSAQFAKLEDPIDWITDKELLDAMGRVARSCDAHLSKGQVRTLKSEIGKCLDEEAKIPLTPNRRSRLLGLLSTYESWSTLPDAVKDSAIENAILSSWLNTYSPTNISGLFTIRRSKAIRCVSASKWRRLSTLQRLRRRVPLLSKRGNLLRLLRMSLSASMGSSMSVVGALKRKWPLM